MRYLIRAVKYFIYICVLLTLVLAILMLLKVVGTDINTLFNQGWTSVGKIALMFAAVAALYPLFGYMKKLVPARGEYANLKDGVVKAMEDRGYKLESEDGKTMKFRLRSVGARIGRTFEDRITLTYTFGGFEMEGLRRDVVRLSWAVENALNSEREGLD